MTNRELSQSNRERYRINFSLTFLNDLAGQVQHGQDPRNRIGIRSGFNYCRALAVRFDYYI